MYFFNLVDDWRADGYRWSQNGTKMIPKHDPTIRKVYFVALLPNGNFNRFKKHAYFLLDFDKAEVVNVVLIHYVGDESIAPHGNSKSGMNFYRTCPSVLSKNFNSSDLPGNIYKTCVSQNDCLPEHHPILKPCNTKQIRNYQQKERQKSRLTHDATKIIILSVLWITQMTSL